jgi:hypothetical protein
MLIVNLVKRKTNFSSKDFEAITYFLHHFSKFHLLNHHNQIRVMEIQMWFVRL